jgi:bifunctional UDP-N-acetylglucosamine pyrophosphorylase/glucosamine-1-phosphate N-acetyltransferase
MGINNRVQLARAEAKARQRVREELMLAGVTMIDPAATYIDAGVTIGRDTVIWPGAVITGDTQVGEGCTIGGEVLIESSRLGSNCQVRQASVLTGCEVADNVTIGPFAHIRAGSSIAEGARVGSYTELVRTRIGARVKALHFSYLGDAEVGADTNIGAGTVTCNYDGKYKHKTIIGEGAFIGSDAILVAPVEIGAGAYVGAGSVITKDVPPEALGIERGKQENLEGWAKKRGRRQKRRGG